MKPADLNNTEQSLQRLTLVRMNELLKASHRHQLVNVHSMTDILLRSQKPCRTAKTYLKHLLDVVVLGLEQLAPGGEVAVGEDAAGLQEPVSVTLQPNSNR